MTPVSGTHNCSDGFRRPLFAFEGLIVCEYCRETVATDPGASEPCDDEGWYCAGTCQPQDGDFIVSIRFNGQDGEGQCPCEHHEPYRVALRDGFKAATVVERQMAEARGL